ncbi:MAG: hypothetical protein P8Y44_10300, partial [Acidobacteriota bacterium]
MKRGLALLVIPVVGILLWSMLPLIRGEETLYFRDVFNTHLEKKWVQAEAMKAGSVPLVDPLRDGGRPLLGNPNAVSLYPDNVLYLVSPFFWAFNAHFWLHLLIAPFAFYWMCRRWGLSPMASWVGGVCYSTSGFVLSTMNLYNLVGGVTLAPALVAASFALVGDRFKGGSVAVVALIWSLLLLAGDPMTALMALLLAGSAMLFKEGARKAPWASWLLALVLGSIVAAPQLIEFLRILPLSFRGYLGYSPEAATAASWNPITSIEWFLPFAFGKPDLAFWGQRFFGGDPPLFPSLYPGVLALLLIGSSGLSRDRKTCWAWMLIALGLFLSLGRYNPVMGWLLAIPGLDLLRLPVKFWLLVVVAGGLLCGVGFQRFEDGSSRRLLAVCWSILLGFYGCSWMVLS